MTRPAAPPVTSLPEWTALTEHREQLAAASLRDLFGRDPYRAQTLTFEQSGVVVDLCENLHDGVEVYEGSRRYLHRCREAGVHRAVVPSSANTEQVLQVTGLTELSIDGVGARERALHGKADADTFLAAADGLGLRPERCAVFEDAEVGVRAGRAGGFGYVIGLDRTGHGQALRHHGAHVVTDLAELL